MTTLSCTLLRGPTRIGSVSPRSTAPNQTLAPASIVTSPISVAFGATKASGATRGRLSPRGTSKAIPTPSEVRSEKGARDGLVSSFPAPISHFSLLVSHFDDDRVAL